MGWWAADAPAPMLAMLRLWAGSSFMLSGSWYLMHSLSSGRTTDEPEPGVEMAGSGDTSFGGVGGKVNRCGLACPADSEDEEEEEEDTGG